MRCRFLASLLMTLFGLAALRAEEQPPSPTEPVTAIRAVIELFTSQGCGDCPPADVLLKSLSEQKDVIALTLPVDYWDYLGWKDTLASANNAARQRAYAKRFDTGPVSTPEAVVNGTAHALGSSREDIERAISASDTALASRRIPVRLWSYGSSVVIEAGSSGEAGETKEATIWVVVMQKTATVQVKGGENAGKTLTYTNVVREMTPVGLWTGRPTTVRLARAAIMHPESEDLVVILQENESGPIIGAAHLGH